MTNPDVWMPIALLVLVAALVCQLGLWHRKRGDQFDLRDLVTDKGAQRVSLSKFGQLVALLVSTWALVHETLSGRLSEWLFGAYMLAWAGAQVASLAFSTRQKPAAEPAP